MKKIKKIFCLLLSGILLTTSGCRQQKGTSVPDAFDEEEAIDYTEGFLPAASAEGLVKIDENARFILYADLSSG